MPVQIAVEAVLQRSQNAQDLLTRLITFIGCTLEKERSHHQHERQRDRQAVCDKVQDGWI